MKEQSILDNLGMLDGLEFRADRRTTRRGALGQFGKIGAGLAVASLPTFLVPDVSFAQDGGGPVDILNYALTLEYLEESYYRQGVNSVIPDDELPAFQLVAEQEDKHVAFLTAAIDAAGGTPVEFTDEDFNFQALGTDPFAEGNFGFFLTLLMGFEDLGVRAYKGQAANIPRDLVVAGVNVLTVALQIHSIEARHAAYVRREREAMGIDVEPWIVLDSGTDDTPLAPIYGAGAPAGMFPAEENTVQGGVDLTTLGYSAEAVSASFDEPLDMGTVLTIGDPFIAGDQTPDA